MKADCLFFLINFVLLLSWFCDLRINFSLQRKILLARSLRLLCVKELNSAVLNCLLGRKTFLARSLRVLCVYEFNSGVYAQNFVALESYLFLFEKLSDIRSWRPNVSSFYLNFVLWLSCFCGLRKNCLLCRKKTLLPWSLRVLCVYEFNLIVDSQDFVALESYVFFCLINTRIIGFEGRLILLFI